MQNNATQCKVMRSNAKQSNLIKIRNQSILHATPAQCYICYSDPCYSVLQAQLHTQQSRRRSRRMDCLAERRLRVVDAGDACERVLSLEQDAFEEYYHCSNHFARSFEETWNHSHRPSSPNPRKRRVRRGERCSYGKGTSTIDCQ